MSEALTNKVLLIGWDAADWKFINPLIDQGHMPALAKFRRQGVWGNIATLNPILSPMLWTSIASGKRPYKHGIHGFIEPMPDGKGIRPSSSTTRKCKAIWNILTQKGYKTHQIGWFCSHPAEPINGAYVTNLYDRVTQQDPSKWKLPDETVHPPEITDALAELRVHPTELVAEQILPFIPNAAKIDQDKDRRLVVFAKLLCEMVNIHSAATWLMENMPWDFMGVYNPAIDHFCHAFMQYHPPKMPRVREEDFDIYKDVVAGCYRFHDMMLDRMLHLTDDDTTVIICSDHGFHSDHLRPLQTPREPAGPAVWHREYGIIAMKGPGIEQGQRVYGATVLDVTPTILTLMGLPVGDDMDGKPLVQAMTKTPMSFDRIASWDEVEGEAGMHPPDKREDPFEARESIQQLVDLGYIDKPDENAERAAAQADCEARYNLARAYLDGGHVSEAAELLEGLVNQAPDQLRFALNLAQCYVAQRQLTDARRMAQEILDRSEQQAHRTADQLERQRQWMHKQAGWQQAEEKAIEQGRAERLPPPPQPQPTDEEQQADEQDDGGQGQPGEHPTGRGAQRRRGPVQITKQMLERADRRIDRMQGRLRNLDVRVTPRARLMLGVLDFYDKQPAKALEHLLEAEKAEPHLPGLHIQIGRVYLRMKRHEDARRAFRKALEIDGDSAVAHDGMAAALLRLRRPTAAAEHALIAVGLLHHYPRAHLRLGIALTRLRMYDQAIEAFDHLPQNRTAIHRLPPLAVTHLRPAPRSA